MARRRSHLLRLRRLAGHLSVTSTPGPPPACAPAAAATRADLLIAGASVIDGTAGA
eukprot:COSAG06_NODE_9117_length_1969_cov_1.535847_4_plen_55_part_01